MTTLGRPVLILTAALLVTRIGAAAAYLGVAWEIWRTTHSPVWSTTAMVATTGLSGIVPVLTAPLADRFDRRTVMVASQSLSAVAWALLAWHPVPATLVVLGVVSVVVESPFFVAVEAAIPNLVADDASLARANSAQTLAFATSWLVGPLVAALLMSASGVGAVFLLDAATSAAAALLISRIHGRFQDDGSEDIEERHGSALVGLRVVRSTPVLRILLGGWFLAMLGFEGANVVFAPLADARHAGSLAYALGLVAWGLGLAVGAWVAGRMRPGGEQSSLAVALLVSALGLAGMGLASSWPGTAAATAIAGVGFGAAFVADAGLVQRATPDAARARVRAIIDGATTVAGLGSMLLAGMVLALAGPAAFLVMGSVLVAVAAVVLRPRRAVELADAMA